MSAIYPGDRALVVNEVTASVWGMDDAGWTRTQKVIGERLEWHTVVAVAAATVELTGGCGGDTWEPELEDVVTSYTPPSGQRDTAFERVTRERAKRDRRVVAS